MFDKVKRGGRQDFTCAGCGGIIPKGEVHFTKRGGKDAHRYHETCLPANSEVSTNCLPVATGEPTTEPRTEATTKRSHHKKE